MSSWAVFAMMGFYHESPAAPNSSSAARFLERHRASRANGNVHVIVPAAATNDPYVQSIKVDGKPSSKTWPRESFAPKGGTLEFDLSDTPNKSWGTNAGDVPSSFGAP
jgi:putative alpha-1,2-mannosidase